MNKINFVDLAIFALLFFYGLEGYSSRFLGAVLDLSGFVLSFLLALRFYSDIGNLISNYFSIPQGMSFAIGFFIIALVSEIFFGLIVRKFFRISFAIFSPLDRALGVLIGMLSGLILVTFILTLITALPVSSYLKNSVYKSKIGSLLVERTQGFENVLNNVFGKAVNETISFLTVEPESDESIDLRFKAEKYSIDMESEETMFDLVNKERNTVDLPSVIKDNKLQIVARDHCIDMVKRGYFSHYTLEGLSPFDRMNKANVYYIYAGENLALSPNVTVAMQGLMNSPGHKANILTPNFGKLGVGVIDVEIFGEAFCQEFTD